MLVFYAFIFNDLSGWIYDILGCPSLAHFTFSIVFWVFKVGGNCFAYVPTAWFGLACHYVKPTVRCYCSHYICLYIVSRMTSFGSVFSVLHIYSIYWLRKNKCIFSFFNLACHCIVSTETWFREVSMWRGNCW